MLLGSALRTDLFLSPFYGGGNGGRGNIGDPPPVGEALLPGSLQGGPVIRVVRNSGQPLSRGMSGFADQHCGAEGPPASLTQTTELPGPSANKGLPSSPELGGPLAVRAAS